MMDKMPLVSVVIPVYNTEEFIEETVESVLSQTYNNVEILVVDDCSTDSTLEVVRELISKDNRVRLVESSENFGGPARPRNMGIENARGEYIAFLDADDIWEEKKLEVQIKHMLQDKLDFSSTGSSTIDENSKNNEKKFKILNFLKKGTSKKTVCDLIQNKFIATSSVILKRSLDIKFTEKKDFVSVEDLCLWLDILGRDKIKYKYIEEKLLRYRVLDNSISARGTEGKQKTKANLCILTFILHTNRFNLLKCFYNQIIKTVRINFLKKVSGR